MAETFNDTQSAENIRNAPTVMAAEEKMKMISGFDESIWNPVRASVWASVLAIPVSSFSFS